MSIATFSTVKVKELLAKAKMNCGIYNSSLLDSDFKYWITEGSKEMCTKWEYEELTAISPICDFKAKLPCEFVEFDRKNPIVFTQNGIAVDSLFADNWYLIYNGQPFVKNSPYQPNSSVVITVEVQSGFLWFSNNCTATECTFSYLGLRLDEDGDVVIPELNSRPIIAYACYMYHLTHQDSDNIIERWNRLWTNGKLERRAKSRIPDSLVKERISDIMNNLL